MCKLTQDQIEQINQECNYGHGIFKQPNHIPVTVKEPVLYMQWESSGRPGSCWDDEDTVNEDYTNPFDIDDFQALHLTLKMLDKPIPSNIHTIINIEPEFDTTSNGYYGDYNNDSVAWILLSDLYILLGI